MQPCRQFKGIVIGATGAVGIQLVIELLKSENWGKVITLTRRDYQLPSDCGLDTEKEVTNGKLEKRIVDFERIEEEVKSLSGYDYMFSCFGTTRKDAGSAAAFMHIDHDYNVNAAKGAKAAGITHYGLLSAVNAKANSWFLYPKCKGLIENQLKEMAFSSLSIFQPGLLDRGLLARWNEKAVLWCAPSIKVAAVAKAMRLVAEAELANQTSTPSCRIVSDSEMKKM